MRPPGRLPRPHRAVLELALAQRAAAAQRREHVAAERRVVLEPRADAAAAGVGGRIAAPHRLDERPGVDGVEERAPREERPLLPQQPVELGNVVAAEPREEDELLGACDRPRRVELERAGVVDDLEDRPRLRPVEPGRAHREAARLLEGQRVHVASLPRGRVADLCHPMTCRRRAATPTVDMRSLTDFVLAELPPPPARVLEVGCGAGELARTMDGAGYEVVAIDPAAPDGEIFRRIKLDELDPAERFDAVVAAFSLHHVIDLSVGLDRIRDVLRPGGARARRGARLRPARRADRRVVPRPAPRARGGRATAVRAEDRGRVPPRVGRRARGAPRRRRDAQRARGALPPALLLVAARAVPLPRRRRLRGARADARRGRRDPARSASGTSASAPREEGARGRPAAPRGVARRGLGAVRVAARRRPDRRPSRRGRVARGEREPAPGRRAARRGRRRAGARGLARRLAEQPRVGGAVPRTRGRGSSASVPTRSRPGARPGRSSGSPASAAGTTWSSSPRTSTSSGRG